MRPGDKQILFLGTNDCFFLCKFIVVGHFFVNFGVHILGGVLNLDQMVMFLTTFLSNGPGIFLLFSLLPRVFLWILNNLDTMIWTWSC